MSINFRQLEVFRAVAKANSFTRASYSLFISQSTVSQHIHELEDALNLKLFLRTRRNVCLTPAGQKLLEHAQNIFQMIEDAELATKAVQDPYRGKLSFGCASTTLVYRLPPILLEYADKYPNVELNIAGGTIQDVASQMWSGALDLALVVLPLSVPGLRKIALFEECFVGVIPVAHPLAKKPDLNIKDVAAERFILHRPCQNTRKLVDRFLFKERITPRVAIELDETEAIKAMVARGFGVSVLPESAFPNGGRYAGIRTFPIDRQDLRRSLALVQRTTRSVRPAVSALVALLQERFKANA
jgi:LysR family transcriptional activator of glutamate synthase operon